MLVIFSGADGQAAIDVISAYVPAGQPVVTCPIAGRVVAFVPSADPAAARALAGSALVHQVIPAPVHPPLVSRASAVDGSVVPLGGTATVGGIDFALIAGPCAVETYDQLIDAAAIARAGGAVALRGGAFKPRTSPYDFQGRGHDGLRMLARAREETGLPIVTEVTDTATVELVARYSDVLQIGTRNAQNFALLKAAGRAGKPVLLKRGFGCTVAEWLNAAEYVLSEGNPNVVLCERGIRSFENSTRFTLDLSAVAVAKRESHLPVVVDPSHGTGHRYLVRPLALAAAAVGADGLLVDIHPDASSALCDGKQALDAGEWRELTATLSGVLASVGRLLTLPEPVTAS